MRISILSIPATLLALALTLIVPLAAVESNESNLVLVDTQNPAILDLAATAGDEITYNNLNDKNKHGVFFSDGLTQSSNKWGFWLLDKNDDSNWASSDFLHASSGLCFSSNEVGLYQPLPVSSISWSNSQNFLFLQDSSAASLNTFDSQLLDPTKLTRIYKRFEFPAGLNYLPTGSEEISGVKLITDYDLNRSRIANPISKKLKLVVVLHGWNPAPNTDPYSGGSWPALIENIHEEITIKGNSVPDWDLYAYNWSKDSYTGPALNGFKHSVGGVGTGLENGIQAAEIGYQHGLNLGKLIRNHCEQNQIHLEKIHFIAHSAGTWVARSASLYLEKTKGASSMDQQITLLDPFNPGAGLDEENDDSLDTSYLNTERLTNGWVSAINPQYAENIYSKDLFIKGTNEEYQNFNNKKVGDSVNPTGGGFFTKWDDHPGPINFYAFSVDPSDTRTSSPWDAKNRSAYSTDAGWDHSLFMKEYRMVKPLWLANVGASVLTASYAASPSFSPSYSKSYSPIFSPSYAPAPVSEWQQILVDVDGNAWVRAMLIPTIGGAAEMAGPVRLKDDGSFSMEMDDGSMLTGGFDTSVTPAIVSLMLDGTSFGMPNTIAQGDNTRRGVDAQVNSAGNVVYSMVLADGTAGMSVASDAEDTGWEGSGVGTVDANGIFTVTGAAGLQITGQLQEDGALDPQAITVAPPQVPEIHVTEADAAILVSGSASRDFGNTPLGTSAAAYVLTIRNTGTVSLTDLGLTFSGSHPSDFSVTGLNVNTLQPDGSVVVYVVFHPQAAGSRNAVLQIASNDENENPFNITLSGTGVSVEPYDIAFVGTPYDLRVGNQVTFDLKRLLAVGETLKVGGEIPSGLKYNATTGLLTGIIAGKPGTYQTVVQVLQGKTVVRTIPLPIPVLEFPSSLIGSFDFLMEDSNSIPVGVCKITITGANKWSATLESAGASKKRSAKGTFELAKGVPIAPITALFPAINATSSVLGVPALTINIPIDGSSPAISGTFNGGTLRGFRIAKVGEMPPANVAYNLVLDAGEQDGTNIPAGYGWLKGKVSNKGLGSFKGLLGDGTSASITLRLSAFGQAILWSQPYKNKSSYMGGIVTLGNLEQTTPGEAPLTDEVWWTKTADAKTLSYPNGFPGMPVTIGTSRWTAPASAIALGSSLGWRSDSKAAVAIQGGGLNNQEQQSTTAKLPTELALDSKFALITSLPIAPPIVVWKGKVSKTDGAISGTLTLPTGFSSDLLSGSAAVSGVLVQDDQWGTITGCGQIKVPAADPKGSFKTAAIVLGK